MKAAGISFGAHTKNHPILGWLDSKCLLEELTDSYEAVKKIVCIYDCWFAYPDGRFSNREERAVKEVGFCGAVQTFRKPEKSGRFAIPRVAIKEKRILGLWGNIYRAMIEIEINEFNKLRLGIIFRSWFYKIIHFMKFKKDH